MSTSEAAKEIAEKQKAQEAAAIARIGEISRRIREGIRQALPAPPEQFFTVMVPGKVVNFEDFLGGFNEHGEMIEPVLPTVTELNQAILCDDMPALSSIQLGPTGRSVSRSYGATLSKLVPKGTTVGVEVTDPSKLSDQEKRYNQAMGWLLKEDERNAPKSHLDTYIEKQKAYTAQVEEKIRKFNAAYDRAIKDTTLTTVAAKRAAYDRWVNENARAIRNDVEGAYKDWVVHGRKEACEYWFSVVDNDSAMARVEQSKEAMRNAVVMDTDGSVEYPKVKLTPSNWAYIAKKKAQQGAAAAGPTVEQLTWEIARLQKVNRMLEVMRDTPPSGKPVDVPAVTAGDDACKKAMAEFIEKRTAVNNIISDKKLDDKARAEQVKKPQEELNTARENLNTALENYNKANLDRLGAVGLQALDDLFSKSKESLGTQIDANQARINELDAKRKELMTERAGKPADIMAKEVGLDNAPSTLATAPAATPAPAAGAAGGGASEEDYFTSVSVEVAASYQHSESEQKSQSTSVAAHGSFWGVSVGGAASHSKSSADAQSQMASSNVKISFDCMRVDIGRSWLRPEFFYDEDLQVAPNALISPGPMKLGALMDPDNYKMEVFSDGERQRLLPQYATFPMYPTGFLLAANVVLEISGETAAIQSHFDTSTTTASASVGYGPFSVSVSHSQSSTHQSSTCETTASGCRITIKSPQIIGWISEMIPALPRGPYVATASTSATVAIQDANPPAGSTQSSAPRAIEDSRTAPPPTSQSQQGATPGGTTEATQ